jgi:hypothetical protein
MRESCPAKLWEGRKWNLRTEILRSCDRASWHVTVHRDMWPCIVTNFFILRPTRCTNFTNFILARNSTCFGQFLCPSSGVYSLYTQQWYMSYRFVDSFRTGPFPSLSCSKAVYKPVGHIPLLSVQWINSWWWAEELYETCRVSWQNKICEINACSWVLL